MEVSDWQRSQSQSSLCALSVQSQTPVLLMMLLLIIVTNISIGMIVQQRWFRILNIYRGTRISPMMVARVRLQRTLLSPCRPSGAA